MSTTGGGYLDQLKEQKNKKKILNVIFITPLGYKKIDANASTSNVDHETWVNFLKWFYDNNSNYFYYANGMDSSELAEPIKKITESNYTNNPNINQILSSKEKLEKLLKLHYFGQNVGDIQTILDNQNHSSYKNACEFVNECLHIFREFKKDYCEVGTTSNYKGSTVCKQLDEFLDRYEYSLYKPLKSHNKMSSLVDYPESAQVRCDISDSLYYTPFWSLYKTNSEEFSVLGNFVVSGFVMFAVYLILLILYKFTPIGLHFSPGGQRKARRIWRKVEMDQFRDSGSSLYSDDNESEYADNYESSSTFVYGNNRYY
ncbi:variable surface protein [Plasmodium gonderi]|uniref:Variable surface protein n=1 Tax=Plasmodium gonderi TaxID=77519 RepID=A0A1Y1J964_PLAGO|nr:variable surface protein [Plasmodium gonderi]GAW79051.1 variable surface protein [Plasmodium gonderi]